MRKNIALLAAAAALLTLPACPFWGNCGDNHEPLVAGAYEFQYGDSYDADGLPLAEIQDGTLTVDLEAMEVTIEYTDANGELASRTLPIENIDLNI